MERTITKDTVLLATTFDDGTFVITSNGDKESCTKVWTPGKVAPKVVRRYTTAHDAIWWHERWVNICKMNSAEELQKKVRDDSIDCSLGYF